MTRPCHNELAVIRATRSGYWPEHLRIHVSSCASCREAMRATEIMRQIAQDSQPATALPDVELILLKARFAEQQRATERAQKPLLIIEFGLITVLSLASIVWLFLNSATVLPVIADWSADLLLQLGSAAWTLVSDAQTFSNPFFLVVALLCVVGLAVATPFLVED